MLYLFLFQEGKKNSPSRLYFLIFYDLFYISWGITVIYMYGRAIFLRNEIASLRLEMRFPNGWTLQSAAQREGPVYINIYVNLRITKKLLAHDITNKVS